MTPMIGVVKLYITATKTGFVSFFDDLDVNSNKFSTTVMWHNEKLMKLHASVHNTSSGNYLLCLLS